MIIATWTDKGGSGKTTLASLIASHYRAPIIDLDYQADISRWAQAAKAECLTPSSDDEAKRLLAERANSDALWVVDCPPGQTSRALLGMGLASLLIVPTRSGNADIVAFGRSLKLVQQVRSSGNPDLVVGVVLNAYRETTRARTLETALTSGTLGGDYHYLGHLGQRVAAEEAYASGKSLLDMGGALATEAKTILDNLTKLLS